MPESWVRGDNRKDSSHAASLKPVPVPSPSLCDRSHLSNLWHQGFRDEDSEAEGRKQGAQGEPTKSGLAPSLPSGRLGPVPLW